MIKKNKLGLAFAITAALGLGSAIQTVQAANIATSGIGEIVYFPYYSTTAGKVSFVRLTNNSFETIAVKLKVREGTFSQDARDFHIFLSPRDVWTASISEVNGEVRLSTTDTSCTVPSKDRGWQDDGNGAFSIDIPAVGNTASREGYVVAQVMGSSDGRLPTQGSLFDAVSLMQHNGNAAPVDCHAVSAAFDLNASLALRDAPGFISLRSQFTEPTNSLSGAAAVVNTVTGTLTDMPVTAVANVINRNADGTQDLNNYVEVGANDLALQTDTTSNDVIGFVADDRPDERDAAPSIATIYDDVNFTATTLNLVGTSSVNNTVTAALMQASLSNYIDTTGGNSWVVTFPTKRLHLAALCSSPFPADCAPDITSIQHTIRDQGALTYVTNEEESEFTTPNDDQICFSGPDFAASCSTTSVNTISLPTEMNVISMGSGNALSSGLLTTISDGFLGNIGLGWMQMRFTDAVSISATDLNTAAPTSLFGLPAIGFAYTEYNSGGITMTQEHTYTSPLRP